MCWNGPRYNFCGKWGWNTAHIRQIYRNAAHVKYGKREWTHDLQKLGLGLLRKKKKESLKNSRYLEKQYLLTLIRPLPDQTLFTAVFARIDFRNIVGEFPGLFIAYGDRGDRRRAPCFHFIALITSPDPSSFYSHFFSRGLYFYHEVLREGQADAPFWKFFIHSYSYWLSYTDISLRNTRTCPIRICCRT